MAPENEGASTVGDRSEAVWREVAERIVSGLGVRSGELIQVRDRAGRREVLEEVLLAVELRGATPLPEIIPPDYMRRMLSNATSDYLSRWDRLRQDWMRNTDRILVLQGEDLDERSIPAGNFSAWRTAAHRLTVTEEQSGPLPFLLAAIPTEERARRLGLSLETLEARILPALLVGPGELQARASRLVQIAGEGSLLKVISGDGRHELKLAPGGRPWIPDDGLIDEGDIDRGGVVSNLPAGSLYTTVLEEETEGELFLPEAGPAREALLRFERGRAIEISATTGAGELEELFDAHSGEPRRVGHLGLGLNPRLSEPLGWTLVDAHLAGHVFVSFGENRYMGGCNASSLNVDFALPGATLKVGEESLVKAGGILF